MATNEPVPNRPYTAEFRAEAVRLAESIGSNPAAERLGIPQSTMSSWVRRARQGHIEPPAAPATPTRRAPSELEAEVSKLQREVASLKIDNEVLRKATAHFVKVSR